MRLYHPQHGYHFETGIVQIKSLKVVGWVEAPKGFHNTLKEQEKPVKPVYNINKKKNR